jgi:hypothetical protein
MRRPEIDTGRGNERKREATCLPLHSLLNEEGNNLFLNSEGI